MIDGVPVVSFDDMANPAADAISLGFGDLSRAYQIVDRAGIRVQRDPYTEKPFVKFYTTKRVGGGVVNFEAVKLLKLSS
jgi:HK97 family phage major capsid protein